MGLSGLAWFSEKLLAFSNPANAGAVAKPRMKVTVKNVL
jgi:hypothetical protein